MSKKFSFESRDRKRTLIIADHRPTQSAEASLNEWDVLEVPRKKRGERPYRTALLPTTDLHTKAEIIFAIDADAEHAGRSRLQLQKGTITRVSYQRARELGVIAGMTVISMD